jgi:hypothetical protein
MLGPPCEQHIGNYESSGNHDQDQDWREARMFEKTGTHRDNKYDEKKELMPIAGDEYPGMVSNPGSPRRHEIGLGEAELNLHRDGRIAEGARLPNYAVLKRRRWKKNLHAEVADEKWLMVG